MQIPCQIALSCFFSLSISGVCQTPPLKLRPLVEQSHCSLSACCINAASSCCFALLPRYYPTSVYFVQFYWTFYVKKSPFSCIYQLFIVILHAKLQRFIKWSRYRSYIASIWLTTKLSSRLRLRSVSNDSRLNRSRHRTSSSTCLVRPVTPALLKARP